MQTLKEYLSAFGRWWWAVVIDYIFGVAGVYQSVTGGATLSKVAWVIVALLAFNIPPVIAYYKLRIQRNGLQRQLKDIKNARPSIEVTPRRDGDNYLLEVKNNGNVADFEAQIKIVKDASGHQAGKLYYGYWELAKSSTASIGNIDRIQIARLETTAPSHGVQAKAPFFESLILYYCDKSQINQRMSLSSSSWTYIPENIMVQPLLKPSYILRVTITSNPAL
jgi:hypothetical protein